MPTFPLLASYISAMIFVGVVWRCRRHFHIPRTLLGSGLVLLVGEFWGLAEKVVGAERIQSLLLRAFPETNVPDEITMGGMVSQDGTEVGIIYWNLMTGFGFVSSIGLLLFGLGLHFFARQVMLDYQARQHPPFSP